MRKPEAETSPLGLGSQLRLNPIHSGELGVQGNSPEVTGILRQQSLTQCPNP